MTKLQNEYCISVSNLRKQYGKDTDYVVDNITFNVKYGTVFGFLGPNGAGKTTTLKILTTVLSPSAGSVYIFGKDLFQNQLERRALNLYGMLWGLRDKKTRKDKVNEILGTFDLEYIRNSKNDELSIGQRRRVQVAREFMHEMSLLFLDEATVGLDPSARRQLLDYIRVHVKSGLTVFFTTHIMEEAEYLCDEIAIVDKGKIVACDSPTDLKQKYWRGAKTMELSFKDPVEGFFVSLLKATINRINSKNSDGNNKCNPSIDVSGKHTITITVANAEEIISEILQLIYRYGLQIENIAINPPSLEEVFLSILNNDLGKFGIK